MDSLGLTTESSFTLNCIPSPSQAGHAPCGELKEKVLGSISGREMLQAGHAKFSESKWSSVSLGFSGKSKDGSFIIVRITVPLLKRKAVSTDAKISEKVFLASAEFPTLL